MKAILAHTEALHKQLQRWRKPKGEQDSFEIVAAALQGRTDISAPLMLKLYPDTLFALGDLVTWILRSSGRPLPRPVPNPPLRPTRKLLRNYLLAKHEAYFAARAQGVQLVIEEDAGLQGLLRTAEAAAPFVPEDILLRYLSIACNQAFLGPEVVHLDLSNACTSNCLFCGYHSPLIEKRFWKPEGWDSRRLPYRKFAEICEDLALLHADQHIAVVGEGDPTTHPELMRVLKDLKRAKLGVGLYTNASALSKENLRTLVDLGVEFLIVNLSGATEQSYAAMQPKLAGKYTRLVENLTAMVAYQRATGRHAPRLTLKHVLTTLNYRDLPMMVEQCHSIGAPELYPELMHQTGDYTRHLLLDQAQCEELRVLLAQAKLDCKRYNIELSDHVEVQLAGLKEPTQDKVQWTYNLYRERGCYAGWFFSRIYTDQSVGFCCRHRLVGSLENQRFRESWQGETYNEMRLVAKYFRPGENAQCANKVPLLDHDCDQCGNFHTNERYFHALEQSGLLAYLGR